MTQSRTDNMIVQRLDEQSSLLGSIVHSQSEIRGSLQFQAPPNDQSCIGSDNILFTGSSPLNSLIRIRAYIPDNKWHSCPAHCRCTCHHEQRFTSSRWLHGALGILFVGYSGYPLGILQRCTNISCQARRALKISVHYIFPAWFLTRSIKMCLINTSLNEIHASLQTKRLVPAGAEVFRLTETDDVDGLKDLFSRGLASPNDIMYQTGQSLVSVGCVLLF